MAPETTDTPDEPETPPEAAGEQPAAEPEAPVSEPEPAEAEPAAAAEPADAERAAEAEPTADEPAEAEGAAVPEPAAEHEAPVSLSAPPPTPQIAPKERKAATRAQRGRRRATTPEERQEVRALKAVARRRRRLQEREKRVAERSPGEATPVAEKPAGTPQVRLGTVVSDKADKTITVRIDIARRHRRYRKIVRSSMTLHAHDERNDAHAGDLVRVVESRPMSRTKRWRLAEVLERAK
jgi:small subunit ribosomal protein S17